MTAVNSCCSVSTPGNEKPGLQKNTVKTVQVILDRSWLMDAGPVPVSRYNEQTGVADAQCSPHILYHAGASLGTTLQQPVHHNRD